MTDFSIEVGQKLPEDITFHMRVRDEKMVEQGDENPYQWQLVNSTDLFKDKRVVLWVYYVIKLFS